MDIFVRFESIAFELDHGDADIGAVIAHAFHIGEQIVENKTLTDRTLTMLQTFNVVQLYFRTEIINQCL